MNSDIILAFRRKRTLQVERRHGCKRYWNEGWKIYPWKKSYYSCDLKDFKVTVSVGDSASLPTLPVAFPFAWQEKDSTLQSRHCYHI